MSYLTRLEAKISEGIVSPPPVEILDTKKGDDNLEVLLVKTGKRPPIQWGVEVKKNGKLISYEKRNTQHLANERFKEITQEF
jgi:hypothetical protein